jgi:pimeloyl-ACP methyl ester carboxylesterase
MATAKALMCLSACERSYQVAGPQLPFDKFGCSPKRMLLLHGLGGNRSQLPPFISEPLRNQYEIISLDLRAHGQAELDDSSSQLHFSQLASDVEVFVRDTGLADDQVFLIGMSMGAALICELLSRERLSTEGALLIRPAWLWQRQPANLEVYCEISFLLLHFEPEEGKERFRRSSIYRAIAQQSLGAAESLLSQFNDEKAAQRAQRLSAIPASAPMRPASNNLPPLQIVAAQNDPIHPFTLAMDLAADLQAAVDVAPPRYEAAADYEAAVRRVIASFAGNLSA